MIVASTPAWNEPPALLARCLRSTQDVVDKHLVFRGGIKRFVDDGRWPTQGLMRDNGVRLAERWARAHAGALRWFVQLDADEILVNGEQLRPILEHYPHAAYPLAYVQEDGQTTLAPFKCLRAPARIVACSEYVRFGEGELFNLAGYEAPERLRPALLELPFIFHTPGLREPILRRVERLSVIELDIEERPTDAVQWPLPPLTLRPKGPTVKTTEDGTPLEYEEDDGYYACPACGARFDTPGICEGSGEAGHEPVAVAAIDADAGTDDATPGSGVADSEELPSLYRRALDLGVDVTGATWSEDALREAIAAKEAEQAPAGA